MFKVRFSKLVEKTNRMRAPGTYWVNRLKFVHFYNGLFFEDR